MTTHTDYWSNRRIAELEAENEQLRDICQRAVDALRYEANPICDEWDEFAPRPAFDEEPVPYTLDEAKQLGQAINEEVSSMSVIRHRGQMIRIMDAADAYAIAHREHDHGHEMWAAREALKDELDAAHADYRGAVSDGEALARAVSASLTHGEQSPLADALKAYLERHPWTDL